MNLNVMAIAPEFHWLLWAALVFVLLATLLIRGIDGRWSWALIWGGVLGCILGAVLLLVLPTSEAFNASQAEGRHAERTAFVSDIRDYAETLDAEAVFKPGDVAQKEATLVFEDSDDFEDYPDGLPVRLDGGLLVIQGGPQDGYSWTVSSLEEEEGAR